MKLTVDCFDLMVKMMTMNMMMMTMMTVGLEEGWIKNFLVRKVCWVLDKQQGSSWASPISPMANFFLKWRKEIQMWRKSIFVTPFKVLKCVSFSHQFVYSVSLC